jgi:hypothetical protein
MDGSLPRDPWSLVEGGHHAGYRQTAPLAAAAVTTESARQSFEHVLAHSGASHVRDSVDERIVAELRARRGRLIDSQTDVGGWPQAESSKAATDRDDDGMPDTWESRHGSDPDVADSQHVDADGMTRLEHFLNARVASPKAN